MKLFFFASFIFNILFVRAQHEYPNCKNTFFKVGTTSTSQCYDKNNRFGKARAYNLKGDKIYEREVRKVGGHSFVSFTFFKNGAVQQAKWRSTPDGGIQWHSNITTFSEDGTELSSVNRNYDDSPLTAIQRKPGDTKSVTADSIKPKWKSVV